MDNIFSSSLSECPYCHAMLSHASDKCQYCGGDLTNTQQKSNNSYDSIFEQKQVVDCCPSCGYRYSFGETNCPICNKRSYSSPIETEFEQDEPAIEIKEEIKQEPKINTVHYGYQNPNHNHQNNFNNDTDDAPTVRSYEYNRMDPSKASRISRDHRSYNKTDNAYTIRNTQTGFNKTINIGGDGKKMPVALKIFLILFGLNFAFPILMVIITIIIHFISLLS